MIFIHTAEPDKITVINKYYKSKPSINAKTKKEIKKKGLHKAITVLTFIFSSVPNNNIESCYRLYIYFNPDSHKMYKLFTS